MSADEAARNRELGVTYVKLKWKRRLARDRDLKRKLDLKWAAFHCLPTLERKKEALQINPFVPLYRKLPTATPPLYGFHGKPEMAPTVASSAAAVGTASGSATSGRPGAASKRPAAGESLISAMRRGRGRSGRDDELSLFESGGAALGKPPSASPKKN